jgi:hypothetical protein
MIARRFTAAVLAAALAVVMLLQAGDRAAAERIGVAAAAENDVSGNQGGTTRALVAGSQVFQQEIIRTGTQSMAQLLFLDETSLSIGPLSEVTLDRFVFNPATGAGDVVLSTARGALRFITGSQSPSNYQVRTPFANIGVRGTIVDLFTSLLGVLAIAQEGIVVLVIGGIEYVLGPGEALFIAADGGVTGPFAHDGEFNHVTGIMPGPLYGSFLPGEHEEIEVPDGSTILLDELFPQEPDDECGYDDECCYECG